jgi:hypothetical protein
MFIDTNCQSFTAGRERDNVVVEIIDHSNDSNIREIIEGALQEPAWGPPTWRDRYQNTYLNRIHPVRRNGEFIGAIVAVTSIQGRGYPGQHVP